jgi:hypothetical protein
MGDMKYVLMFQQSGETVPEVYITNSINDASELLSELSEEAIEANLFWESKIFAAHVSS